MTHPSSPAGEPPSPRAAATGAPASSPDDDIRAVLQRLSRRHHSGGHVIERAAILAEGADFDRVVAWIDRHGGRAEAVAPPRVARGLHAPRQSAPGTAITRFILPAGALR